MYKNVLQSIDNVGIFPIISILIFMSVFVFMIVRILRMKKNEIKKYSSMPLDDDAPSQPFHYN